MTSGRTIYCVQSGLSALHSQSSSVKLLRSRGTTSRKYLQNWNWTSSATVPEPPLKSYPTILQRRLFRSPPALQQRSICRISRSKAPSRGYPQPQEKTPCAVSTKTSKPDLGFYRSLPRPFQSSFDPWAAAAAASLLAILYAFITGDVERSTPQSANPPASQANADALDVVENETEINMTQGALPGRVGHLTAEEEEKLKEFWVATLQVFGVLDAKTTDEDASADGANGTKKTDAAGSKKSKKKRMGLFRRSKDSDADSTTSTESGARTPTVVSESDDKYGQTKEFHEALANQSPESLRATFWSMVKHDHPDALLLRFLRARKWDVEKALIMMISTMRWRAKDIHVDDDIMKNGELASLEASSDEDPAKKRLGEDFLAQLRMGKSYLHGLDKEGRPMCIVRARLHRQGEQSEESLERYTVYTIETARMILAPPADTACVVFDMTGFSLANMDYAPVKFMIKCFEANYPESLGVVLVHKAPWVFQGIWKIIKGWLDPVVASKVHFTNSTDEMSEFIPRSHIMKELGGDEDWTYQYKEAVPGENDKMKDTETRNKLLTEREATVDEYEKVTIDWIQSTDADSTAIKEKRHQIADSLRVGYWVLDPYVRAKSYYDRVGMIGPSGVGQFYPAKDEPKEKPKEEPKASNGVAATPVETSADDLD
ncbi:CRAL protein [Venustampulla echinocandica]|uniref:CRAL protein n=1 Tax=Venustampulla echinocandica TaxID=2656787 RepID=A0A370T9V0_9HELO|nr:CRAL protein [Venustampulla echinocandica]RDL30447.1 CRAL protein [Venustampulla echinocandica]